MNEIWERLYREAHRVLKPRKVSEMMETAGVAAAVESTSGNIYVGVCVDSACTLGICAERNAIFNMLRREHLAFFGRELILGSPIINGMMSFMITCISAVIVFN